MGDTIEANLRAQDLIEGSLGYRVWQEKTEIQQWPAEQVAVLLCDVWDKHWCRGAVERLDGLLPRMQQVVTALRNRGALIIHAPSDTMDFYADSPARKRVLDASQVDPPIDAERDDPPLLRKKYDG